MYSSKKSNFSQRQQIILNFSNKEFCVRRCQVHPQLRTTLLLSPSIPKYKPDMCISSLYICITMQQQFTFLIRYSLHPLQPIIIPFNYRFQIYLKLIMIPQCAPPFLFGRVKPPTKFSTSGGEDHKILTFTRDCWERRSNLFQGDCKQTN